jgi:hypothetical protein
VVIRKSISAYKFSDSLELEYAKEHKINVLGFNKTYKFGEFLFKDFYFYDYEEVEFMDEPGTRTTLFVDGLNSIRTIFILETKSVSLIPYDTIIKLFEDNASLLVIECNTPVLNYFSKVLSMLGAMLSAFNLIVSQILWRVCFNTRELNQLRTE